MIKNAKQNWLNLGYELFAQEGTGGIQVERLARILKLNKSGFYHYFKSPDNFLNELFDYHRTLAHKMAEETAGCERLDPDYFRVVVKFKVFVLVQSQLARKKDHAVFGTVLNEVRDITNKPLLPLWQKTFSLPNDMELVLQHFSLYRNAFNAQATMDNVTYDFLHDMMVDSLNLMREVFKYQVKSGQKKNLLEKVTVQVNDRV
jgi:AcrR family transcriptional regulator